MKSPSEPLERKDGRKKFVVYLDPKIIQAVKMRALQEDRHAYELVEEVLARSFEKP